MRPWKLAAALTLAVGLLAAGPAAADPPEREERRQRQTWVGQVERHGRHYDYVGSPCAEGQICAQYVARYRIVPTTWQAARGLRRAAGHNARLNGLLLPFRDPDHQGRLMISRVRVVEREPAS
jgi:hypothetical protein